MINKMSFSGFFCLLPWEQYPDPCYNPPQITARSVLPASGETKGRGHMHGCHDRRSSGWIKKVENCSAFACRLKKIIAETCLRVFVHLSGHFFHNLSFNNFTLDPIPCAASRGKMERCYFESCRESGIFGGSMEMLISVMALIPFCKCPNQRILCAKYLGQ